MVKTVVSKNLSYQIRVLKMCPKSVYLTKAPAAEMSGEISTPAQKVNSGELKSARNRASPPEKNQFD